MADQTKEDVNDFLSEVVKTLVSLIEEKDVYMRGHAQRVASNCVFFSRKVNFSKNDVQQIYFAGLLHDIAMVYIPIEIFQKSGKLDENEIAIVKQHPVMAEKVLSNLSRFQAILPIVRHHHEAFDGSGYPDGLKGDEIPLGARVLSLVDSYDAMTSARSDRPAMSIEAALRQIVEYAGKQFDKSLIKDFIEFINDTAGSHKGGDEEEKDKVAAQEIVAGIVKRFKDGNIDLPVLPRVVQEVQNVINQPNSTATDMAKVVEKDAVISVRLIFMCNSPVYRGTEKFYSVSQAIPRLGFQETQSIVTAIANKSLYETKNVQFRMLMEKLWLHSLACGYASRAIAKKVKFGHPEQVFLMGLIHDIGKPPLLKVLGATLPQNELPPMADIIESIQKAHTAFGRDILDRWGFAQDFSRIALAHEGPNFNPKTEKNILIVNLANNIARKIGYSIFDDEVDLLKLKSAELLQIDQDTLAAIGEEVKNMIQDTAHIF